jgi:hypothetical protein
MKSEPLLEVYRHRLPESIEHMQLLIVIAYRMVTMLYETVLSFEDSWIECLGDIRDNRL